MSKVHGSGSTARSPRVQKSDSLSPGSTLRHQCQPTQRHSPDTPTLVPSQCQAISTLPTCIPCQWCQLVSRPGRHSDTRPPPTPPTPPTLDTPDTLNTHPGITDLSPGCRVARSCRVGLPSCRGAAGWLPGCRVAGCCRVAGLPGCAVGALAGLCSSCRVAHHETHLRERSLSDW